MPVHLDDDTTSVGRRPSVPPGGDRTTRRLLACGVVGGPMFVIALLVAGSLRPGYSQLRNLGSQLSVSDHGWSQIANFVVTGVLMILCAAGMWRALRPGWGSTWGPILIGVGGIALVCAGIFVTDPAQGYPVGVPPGPTTAANSTYHGQVHGIAGMIAFVLPSVATVVFARRFTADRAVGGRRWAAYSLLTTTLVGLFFVAHLAAGVQVGGLGELAGLFQRVAIAVGWIWIGVVAARLRATLPVRGRPAI